jgi:glucoamylase
MLAANGGREEPVMSVLRPVEPRREAPGRPGIAPTWTSSAKDIVGCALGPSRVWFTMGYGIVNEVYYPRVDLPQIRDLGFIVADGEGFWVEVKRLGNYTLRLVEPGVPAVEVRHRHERFELHLRVTPDPIRDVLLVELCLDGDAALRPYVLLAPHLGDSGWNNEAAVMELGGRRVLTAEQGPFGLALAAVDERQQDAFGEASAGHVGVSDGWQDFDRHGAMRWQHSVAGPGNVALTGALPRFAVLGLGFGSTAQAAATLAVSSLQGPFERHLARQRDDWRAWHGKVRGQGMGGLLEPASIEAHVGLSAMVLRTLRDQTYPGTMVASLSVPWGNTRDDLAGYHLVWPRDLVACSTALLALGAVDEARDSLRYLIATQAADGYWAQNQWLGGTPHWTGIQLDETAAPVLLAAALAERDALDGIEVGDMVRRALRFIARTGPGSDQDRWEENAGINAFTLAFAIAALVEGARFVDAADAALATALADFWNAGIERWTAVADTPLARRLGVAGYYTRMAPIEVMAESRPLQHLLVLKNRESSSAGVAADEEVSTDFLQLVRFGLRSPDDAHVAASLRVIDALLRADTPNGPVWRRYNGDGYGEHDDGRAFDGTGRGRGWPLLTGERGHVELVAGRDPLPFLNAMAAMAGPSGLLPEQVWDAEPLADAGLLTGRPTGSAMPLGWAHAEYIKLALSRQSGAPVDRPAAVWRRYGGKVPKADRHFWLPHAPIAGLPRQATLVIAFPGEGQIHWGIDDWQAVVDEPTKELGLGLHGIELSPDRLGPASRIVFTWRTADGAWSGRDVVVARG